MSPQSSGIARRKWATSAALSGLFTVLSKQAITSKKTGKTKDKVTALICTPDMAATTISYQMQNSAWLWSNPRLNAETVPDLCQ